MSNTGIYTITSPSNKVYVGQSHDIKRRIKQYKGGWCENQTKLVRSLKKYGFDAHQFNVILELKEDIFQSQLDYWEQFFMDHYRNEGYQLLNLREGGSYGKMSEESKSRLSKVMSGKKRSAFSEAHKLKLSESNKQVIKLGLKKVAKYWLGKNRSDETRRNISLGKKGKKIKNPHHNHLKGEKHGRSKLTSKQVRIIVSASKFGCQGIDLAKIFNVGSTTIYEILNGTHWSLITGIKKPHVNKWQQ